MTQKIQFKTVKDSDRSRDKEIELITKTVQRKIKKAVRKKKLIGNKAKVKLMLLLKNLPH